MGLAPGYDIRRLSVDDAEALAAAYTRNRAYLAPWEPVRDESYYTAAGQAPDVARRLDTDAAGLGASWVLWCDREVVGRINLNNIARGAFQSASVGYWVSEAHRGRGLAGSAVEYVCDAALALGLHRLEAGTVTSNVASQRVLAKCGFTFFGTAQQYLLINGAWQDHHLYQKILHDRTD